MSNAERKLVELFASDMPPANDRAFAFSVLERIERRRMWADTLEAVPFVLAAGVLLWATAPTIANLVDGLVGVVNAPSFMAAVVLTLAGLAFIGIGRRGIWEL